MAELVEYCEGGADHDAAPLQMKLPLSGQTIDSSFFSRLRSQSKVSHALHVLHAFTGSPQCVYTSHWFDTLAATDPTTAAYLQETSGTVMG